MILVSRVLTVWSTAVAAADVVAEDATNTDRKISRGTGTRNV